MAGIAGVPGIGGSLGQCAVCGEGFIAELLFGTTVQTIAVKGFNQDMCVHEKCCEILKANGKDWRTLPDGPLRRAFEEANKAALPTVDNTHVAPSGASDAPEK